MSGSRETNTTNSKPPEPGDGIRGSSPKSPQADSSSDPKTKIGTIIIIIIIITTTTGVLLVSVYVQDLKKNT